MEIRIWNWCKQAVLVTTGKWMKLNYFFSVLDVHVSWYVFRLLFFLRKPIQITYKLKCSKTQQVWPSFIFNNELKYFWRHFLFCHAPAFSQDISELFIIRLLKLRYSEKATKFEKNLPLNIWRYWVTSNYKWKIFFQICALLRISEL